MFLNFYYRRINRSWVNLANASILAALYVANNTLNIHRYGMFDKRWIVESRVHTENSGEKVVATYHLKFGRENRLIAIVTMSTKDPFRTGTGLTPIHVDFLTRNGEIIFPVGWVGSEWTLEEYNTNLINLKQLRKILEGKS